MTPRVAALVALALLEAATALGQPRPQVPATPPAEAPVSSAEVPLQCWWRASAGAIRVGEVVEVTLTCSALESDAVRAVPDESRLTVAAVQMAPWEIVGGSHPADTRAGSRRLFQYTYQLRMLDADALGRDVKLPPLAIPYRVQSRMGADATLAGRDQLHVLPQIPIRVVSQVPGEASDIRDGSSASLAEIAALRFRANAFRMTGTALAALAAVAVLGALAPMVGRLRKVRTAAPGRASDRAVLAHAAARLDDLAKTAASAGWSAETVREAHAAVRLLAGVLLGDGVRQARIGPGEAVPEGRLLLERRFGRVRTALTASATAGQVARALAALPPDGVAEQRRDLERVRGILSALSQAQFGQHASLEDRVPIDEAVAAAADLGRTAASERLWSLKHWVGRGASAQAPVEF